MKSLRFNRFNQILTACVVVIAFPVFARAGTIYSAFGDFSTSSNPNGAWSYGTTPTLGGAFSFYPNVGGGDCGNANLQGWQNAAGPPYVLANTSGSPAACASTVSVPIGVLDLHPSSAGADSVVRWTAPAGGIYQIAGLFEGLDFLGPTTTDVHVLLNGSSVFNANVNSYNVPMNFSLVEQVSAGGTIDFVVGFGSDANYFSDSTGLQGTITSVPEPGTFCASVTAIILLFGRLRKRML